MQNPVSGHALVDGMYGRREMLDKLQANEDRSRANSKAHVKSIDRKRPLQEQPTKVIFGTKDAEQIA